ncbi:MAG: shikimate kinase [Smithellaceae bacterium]|nr:shikimate kinase [Smithellaceae bacterium]
MNIVLIGYRCTGKTSVGKVIAKMNGIPFIDTDEMIEQAEGTSIRAMVEKKGWSYFREREREAVTALPKDRDNVIATGGGVVTDRENVCVLKKGGKIVWLVADGRTIAERMRRDPQSDERRPPLGDGGLYEEIASVLAQREPYYRAAADFSIDTDGKDVEVIAREVLALIAVKDDSD